MAWSTLFVGIKLFFRIWFTRTVTFLIWFIAFLNLILESNVQKPTPNTSTITQDLFSRFQAFLEWYIFVTYDPRLPYSQTSFQRPNREKKEKKRLPKNWEKYWNPRWWITRILPLLYETILYIFWGQKV